MFPNDSNRYPFAHEKLVKWTDMEGEWYSGPRSWQSAWFPMLMREVIRNQVTKYFPKSVIKRKSHRFLVIWSPLYSQHLEGNSRCYLIKESDELSHFNNTVCTGMINEQVVGVCVVKGNASGADVA